MNAVNSPQTHDSVLQAIVDQASGKTRILIGIAGPPGAGKSTFAASLAESLCCKGIQSKVVPMDGFHLDNAKLDTLGLRARKGAHNTFDAHGFVALIQRLKTASDTVSIPTFDRESDRVIADSDSVLAEHKVLLIEGNYLLLQDPPWSELHSAFDLTVMLNPGQLILERRLIQRWLDHGHTAEAARARALENDIPNADLVLSRSRDADHFIAQD